MKKIKKKSELTIETIVIIIILLGFAIVALVLIFKNKFALEKALNLVRGIL